MEVDRSDMDSASGAVVVVVHDNNLIHSDRMRCSGRLGASVLLS